MKEFYYMHYAWFTAVSSGRRAHDEIMTNFTLARFCDNTNSFDHELNRGQKKRTKYHILSY